MKINYQLVFRLLQWATVCVFAGRAWQHLFFEAPYRELIWDEKLMRPLVEGLITLTWQEYVTHPQGDFWIRRWVVSNGILLAACALSAAFIFRLPRFFRIFLWLGAANLLFLALLYLKESFFHLGQFLEYSLQFASPIFLWYVLTKGAVSNKLVLWMKIAIALTFTCHGLYALGYYPSPGSFSQMTMQILGFDEQGTRIFLNVAGVLDFVVGVGIFLPGKWVKPMLLYAAAWGLATSLARIMGNYYWQFPLESLHQYCFETVLRLPHFFIPLAVFFCEKLRPDNSLN